MLNLNDCKYGYETDSDAGLWNLDLHFANYTPPLSPDRDCEYEECFDSSEQQFPLKHELYNDDNTFLPNGIPDIDLKSKIILQDCMWSGIGYDRSESSGRVRKVSLSELTMASASTSCVDPTTFTAYPRQQNQVEHNYSLATPEPMRVPKLHSYSSPVTTDDSESEEDMIDVVTVDTRTRISSSTSSTRVFTKHSKASLYAVHHNLQAVAQKLSTSCKRPKVMSDHDSLPKKVRRISSTESSLMCSQSSSDNEESEGKRSAHNIMERYRRNSLKNRLHDLRDSIPKLQEHERAAKVVILSHAADYVHELQAIEQSFQIEYNKLKSKNTKLKEQLASLQSIDTFY